MGGYAVIGAFLFVGVLFGTVLTLGLSYVIRPHDPYGDKLTTYECGIEPDGSPWVEFNVRYYLFALVFVVFDVETVFLYPWACVLKALAPVMGSFIFWEMMIFLAVLVVGFAYAWKKEALQWT